MTQLQPAALDENPLVLAHRPLRPGSASRDLSRLHDDVWDFTPAIFEEHADSVTLRFGNYPARWRSALKTYLWVLLNDEEPRPMPTTQDGAPLAVLSVKHTAMVLRQLFATLEEAGITDLADTDALLLEQITRTPTWQQSGRDRRTRLLLELRRLWAWRDRVPPPLQMGDGHSWLDLPPRDLLGPREPTTENKTPRLSDTTLAPLMSWAIRFVTELAPDITAGYRQFFELSADQWRYRPPDWRPSDGGLPRRQRLHSVLDELRTRGLGLPGRIAEDGTRQINWTHLARLAHASDVSVRLQDADIVASAGLPIDDDAYLLAQPAGRINGAVWLDRHISWTQAVPLASLLRTAALIVITYLSGMRPGEVLGLRRGCLAFDDRARTWTVTGTRWKSATALNGQKMPEGEERTIPWVVHPVAATAIQVLEQLHDDELLFPAKLRPARLRNSKDTAAHRLGHGLTSSHASVEIASFTDWVNSYCAERGLRETIPPDPAGSVTPSRFRRTLAWHIVRRPRGLVAAAIQYGHVATQITQGYAGTGASGFPNDLAWERWLERVEELSSLDDYRHAGGRISGPAAGELARRASESTKKYLGRTIPTRRQAEQLLKSPLLQVYPGDGMHCVFDRSKALCVHGDEPAQDTCDTRCQNIARTDDDIAQLREHVQELRADPLAPPIRHQRAHQIAAAHLQAIHHHEDPSREMEPPQ